MKEIFEFLWSSGSELLSLIGIIGILVIVVVKVTVFCTRIETRLDTMEKDIVELKRDVSKILEYLVTGKVEVLLKK